MRTLLLKLACVAVLLSSCRAKQTVIADPKIPHRIAERVKVKVWLRKKGKEFQMVEVEFLPGWWILPPQWAKE